MSLRHVLLALIAALALPATAAAAPPWTAPQTVPDGFGYDQAAVATGRGHVTAVSSGNSLAPSLFVPLAADGTPGPVRPLSIANAMIAAYAADHVAVAGSTLDGRNGVDDRSHVQVITATPTGNTGPARGLTGSTGARAFAIAGNARGDLAVLTGDASRRRTLYLRRAGSTTFRVVLRLAMHRYPRDATVALGPKGDVLVVWEDDHVIYARHLGPTGHAGPAHRIGDGVQSHLEAAIDDEGRLEVAWETQRVNEGDASGPATVRFATAAAGHGFGPQRTLETVGATGTGRYVAAPGVRMVLDGPGRALLAWTGYQDGRYVVRAADFVRGHRGTPQTVSPATGNAVLADLAADPKGAATVFWRAGVAGADADGTGPPALTAAHRAAGAVAFGAPEVVSEPGESAESAAGAVEPVGGRTLVVYGTLAGPVRASARP